MSPRRKNRVQWGSIFTGLVESSLRTSLNLIRENADTPTALRPHLESILSQVEWGYRIHPHMSATLLAQLDPWPARWGLLDLWATQLERALPQLPANTPLSRQLSASLTMVYYQMGRLEQAGHIASGLLGDETLAAEEYADLVIRCGGAWVSTLTKQRQERQAEQVIEQLTARLENLAPQLPLTLLASARAVLALQLALLARHHGKNSSALQIMGAAIRRVQAAPDIDRYLLSDLIENRAIFYWAEGQYQSALDDLDTIQTRYTLADDEMALASLHGNRGLIYFSMHRLSEAEQETQRAIAFTEKNKATYLLMKQVCNLGIICLARGDMTNALVYIARQLELAELINDEYEKILARDNRVAGWIFSAKLAEALPEALSIIHSYELQGNDELLVGACLNLSICYFLLGEHDQAASTAHRAQGLVEKNNYARLKSAAMYIRAINLEPAPAAELLQQALILAREHSRRLDEAGCLLWLAHLATDNPQRQAYWQAGEQILAAMGADKWLPGKTPGDAVLLPILL